MMGAWYRLVRALLRVCIELLIDADAPASRGVV
jgi:hypothetical protein